MPDIRLDVPNERGAYTVVIGAGSSRTLANLLAERGTGSKRLVVTNSRVWRLHGRRIGGVTDRAPLRIGEGERAKTLDTTALIYRRCVRDALDRSSVVVAFGGGVVGDVAGFAAATYLRGLSLVQVPTTLLAQVDSSIGGKVGVNLPSGKNLVGSFHPPRLVVCDPEVLATLAPREFQAGLYEVVKYGIIASADLFADVVTRLPEIRRRDPAVLTPLIAACCRIKADVVTADERESGLRRILNFGHTVGHALEAMTNYRRFRHGEAIGYGMLAASALSHARGLLTTTERAAIADAIRQLGKLPPVSDLMSARALDAIAHDKKVVHGKLHFVLANGIGRAEIVADVSRREITAAMRAIGMKG